MTLGDLVAGRFTLNDLIEGLSPLAACVCLALGLAVIAAGIALLLGQNFAALLTLYLNILAPICIALYGLMWTVGSAGALLRRLRRSTPSHE
jgi:hypothetical protein